MSFVDAFQKNIESETVKTSEVFKKTIGTISESVKGVSPASVVVFHFEICTSHQLSCRVLKK